MTDDSIEGQTVRSLSATTRNLSTVDDITGHWQSERLRVVVSDHGAYSIWPLERDLPAGWQDTGVHGSKAACLEEIRQRWTQLAPSHLPDAQPQPAAVTVPAQATLVDLLIAGETGVRLDADLADGDLERWLARGFVYLNLPALPEAPRLCIYRRAGQGADSAAGARAARVVRFTGELTVDGMPLTCRVEIDGESGAGSARFAKVTP